jgi:peptidoglycan hydrolase CwlO-like protein
LQLEKLVDEIEGTESMMQATEHTLDTIEQQQTEMNALLDSLEQTLDLAGGGDAVGYDSDVYSAMYADGQRRQL